MCASGEHAENATRSSSLGEEAIVIEVYVVAGACAAWASPEGGEVKGLMGAESSLGARASGDTLWVALDIPRRATSR